MKHVILFLFTLFLNDYLYSQTAKILFETDTIVTASIYKPIDGGYNRSIVSEKATLTPQKKFVCDIEVAGVAYVPVVFQNGKEIMLIAYPDDEINVAFQNGEFHFEGSNSAGQSFFYNNYVSKGLMKYLNRTHDAFEKLVTNQLSIDTISRYINSDTLLFDEYRSIDNLLKERTVTEQFAVNLRNNLQICRDARVVACFRTLFLDKSYAAIAKKDSMQIIDHIDSIFKKYQMDDDFLIKCSYGKMLLTQYYYYKYKNMPAPPTTAWGRHYPYTSMLYAPKKFQSILFGNAFMAQFIFGANEFDMKEAYDYFKKEFPDSGYLPAIEKNLQSIADSDWSGSTIIEPCPDSLGGLSGLEILKGKYLMIDLWATWCAPCKAEFAKKEDLYQLLESFDNLSLVYLSLDDERSDQSWKRDISKFKLAGYHLRASKKLVNDLRERVYGGTKENIALPDSYSIDATQGVSGVSISIPRYVLLSPEGEVLETDLPRLNDIDGLRTVLLKHLDLE